MTLYLSNWSSYRTPGMHGPGRKLTIMARPRAWEVGDGRVPNLIPSGPIADLMAFALAERAAGSGTSAMEAYRAAYCDTLDRGLVALRPRHLSAFPGGGMGGGLSFDVDDGDTLCCACSVAEARAGRCHRTWCSPFLVRAGWRVILDGVEVMP